MTRVRFLLVGLAALASLVDTARADTLRVAVAGNFVPALERLLGERPPEPAIGISVSTGSTGKLYAQIVQGAPFDLFLAADVERPQRLEESGHGIPGTRTTYARGRLALWAPGASAGTDVIELLSMTPPPRVALANPRLAPYGVAAEGFLRNRGLWSTLEARAIRGESIAQAYHFTASGNAALGFVAASQLRHGAAVHQGAHVILPATSHPAIEQQAIMLQETTQARAFLAWLLSPAVQRRLQDFGYDST